MKTQQEQHQKIKLDNKNQRALFVFLENQLLKPGKPKKSIKSRQYFSQIVKTNADLLFKV